MFNILIKTVVIYLVITFVMRIMGKKQAGQLQPYELVITLIIAEVASKPLDGPNTPISYGLVPAITLLLLYFLFTFLSLKNNRLRLLICGKPTILIHNGKILYHELQQSNCSLSDLIEQLRISGNSSIAEIHYAILETNGQLSVLPYSAHCPVTPEDLSVKTRTESPCISIIMDGSINPHGAKHMKLSKKAVQRILNRAGFSQISDILLFTLSDSGDVFLQDKQGKTQSFHLPSEFFHEVIHE